MFDPWVGKIPWRREWLPTPVFLPGEFHGQRSLASYSPWGHKESDTTERLTLLLLHRWRPRGRVETEYYSQKQTCSNQKLLTSH